MPRRSLRLRDLAKELGRDVEGDADVEIAGVAPLEGAGPRDLCFARSERYLDALAATRAGAVIAPPGLDTGGRPTLRSPDPALDFARVVRRLHPEPSLVPGVHASAVVSAGAKIDPSACVGPGCWIGEGASVGPRTRLHANASLYPRAALGADCVVHANCVLGEDTRIGDRVTLHPGAVIGADGFGYVANDAGDLEKVPQIGRVVIEDDVEIGANTTVDRGTLTETRIGRGAKIDNLVQIGHNCVIGERAVLAAQVGLSGSTRVEAGAILMGQAGTTGHLRVGAGAYVGPQSGVHNDVPAGARVIGSPPRPLRRFFRSAAALHALPALVKRVRALERRLGVRQEAPDGEEE